MHSYICIIRVPEQKEKEILYSKQTNRKKTNQQTLEPNNGFKFPTSDEKYQIIDQRNTANTE